MAYGDDFAVAKRASENCPMSKEVFFPAIASAKSLEHSGPVEYPASEGMAR